MFFIRHGLMFPQTFRNHIHSWLQYHATLCLDFVICLPWSCMYWVCLSYVGVPSLRLAAHTARFVVSVFIAPSGLWVPFINLFITIRHSESFLFTGSHYSDYYKIQNSSILWLHWDIRTILALHQNTGTKITDRWSGWLFILSLMYTLILLNLASVLFTLKTAERVRTCVRVCPFVDPG